MAVKPKNTPTPNPLTREVNSLRNEVLNYRERIYQYERTCEEYRRRLSDAEAYQLRATDAQNRMLDEIHANDAAIKALKEENSWLRDKAVDADTLKGAVNALRRVIVEALQG